MNSLTILVPTFRRAHLLPRLLRVLANQTREHANVDLLVIDNAGEQLVAELVAQVTADTGVAVQYLVQPKPGIAEVRNLALSVSSATHVAFVDDDTIPGDAWTSTALHVISAFPDVRMFGGPVDPVDEMLRPLDLPKHLEACCGVQRYPDAPFELDERSPRMLIGGNTVLDREFAVRIGGFHSALSRRGNNVGSLEDHEFFLRMTGAGGRGRFELGLQVDTIVPASRLSWDYTRRWKNGHGYYSSLLDYVLVRRRDHRATASSVLGTFAPAWAARELAELSARRDEEARLRRAFLRGYLRGAARLALDRALRDSIVTPPPLLTATAAAARG